MVTIGEAIGETGRSRARHDGGFSVNNYIDIPKLQGIYICWKQRYPTLRTPIESRSEKNNVPAVSLRARRRDRDQTRMKWG